MWAFVVIAETENCVFDYYYMNRLMRAAVKTDLNSGAFCTVVKFKDENQVYFT